MNADERRLWTANPVTIDEYISLGEGANAKGECLTACDIVDEALEHWERNTR